MYCSAAPIRNIHGQLAGILDISSEGSPFKFDPSAIVGLYAASIENRLLAAHSNEHLVVRFQFVPAILDTPMVGMLGLDHNGKLAWVNSVASNLLGIPPEQEHRPQQWVKDIFDISFSNLASLAGSGLKPLRLRSGLQIYMQCDFYLNGHAHVGITCQIPCDVEPCATIPVKTAHIELSTSGTPTNAEAMVEKASSLKQADADLIQKVLKECKGNVSLVAKILKVSRGLIYRRMTVLGIDAKAFKT
jgi:transcriptional regulator of acetoin/glycerol metabolism